MPRPINKLYAYLLKQSFVFMVLFFLLPIQNIAQEVAVSKENIFNPLTDDITKKIPPLDVLIDSALINSHRLKYWDKEIKITEYELKSTKRYWSNSISINGELKEGKWTSLVFVQDEYGKRDIQSFIEEEFQLSGTNS